MIKQSKEQRPSLMKTMRILLARSLLRFARRLAYMIAPELRAAPELKDEAND